MIRQKQECPVGETCDGGGCVLPLQVCLQATLGGLCYRDLPARHPSTVKRMDGCGKLF